ncbi:17162_t:CDS:2 [Cetraspora pellucida]|uniref:17162_t:CDS:1 n=1 Tax=Cetraspora pellucida TaxID=1433469 RepID=A0A9N9IF12_9GLOM|nr:17162_t:CDS:2 [Cetraspora pellucida]
MQEIDFTLLKASINLINPSFEINFDYNYPYINASRLKVLLDYFGFIYLSKNYNISNNSFSFKITVALQWLFEHNQLFKENCILDKNALNNLPKGEIPKALTLTTTMVNINSRKTEHYTEFPVLYPYGVREHKGQLSQILLSKYTNYLMHCYNPKFRQHRSFPFIIFNVLQWREVSRESYNLMKNNNFDQLAKLISTLKPEHINFTIKQEQKKQPINNSEILKLLRKVNSASSNSIVMMYAKNEIDPEKLALKNFPKALKKAQLTHLDLVAVAKYFNTII